MSQTTKSKRVFTCLMFIFTTSAFSYFYFLSSNSQLYAQTLCSVNNKSIFHFINKICPLKTKEIQAVPKTELDILLAKNGPRNGLSAYVDINDSSKEYHDHCSTCAVVSSAGILEGSRAGKDIDSHECVFRMNHHGVNGFEQDVGKRTSHR